MNILIFILIGTLAGSIMGLAGVGGGVLTLVLLLNVAKFPQLTAQGTTLLVVAAPLSLAAALKYWQNGHVNVKAAMIIAVFFLISSYIAAHYAQDMNKELIRQILGAALVLIGIRMVLA